MRIPQESTIPNGGRSISWGIPPWGLAFFLADPSIPAKRAHPILTLITRPSLKILPRLVTLNRPARPFKTSYLPSYSR
ncbi:uncharacterized protein N7529_000325 [Penicillium soppii]|uniref:uncharacterized protein n=1 Tax=Penicillium soppii TaxID=69789 RepID=UPI002546B4E3|nr:uncharacterized protein N7529_000325 [Penicillium soppii]KAJ5881653.1 hypothetical protein N7529_000325 [Penicillium soppii]